MSGLETLRVALEASVAAQLALFTVFLFARADWRRPTGFFLSAMCGGLALAFLLNTVTSAGVAVPLRGLNYFIELAIGPLLLGLVARAGGNDGPLRWSDVWYAAGPLFGVVALISGWRHAPDVVALFSAWVFTTAALAILWQRRRVLREAHCLDLIRGVVVVVAIVSVMRLWMTIDAEFGRHYRTSLAYLGVLLACFGLAAQILWVALRRPEAFALPRRAQPRADSSEARALDAAFDRLMDGNQLYLRSELALADIAAQLRVRPHLVTRMISARFGLNISAYLNQKRAEFAAQALISSDAPITTIMYDAGFGSKSAFQREFARTFGTSPSEYRRRHALCDDASDAKPS
jgi:AraC-like DNA-binding protein